MSATAVETVEGLAVGDRIACASSFTAASGVWFRAGTVFEVILAGPESTMVAGVRTGARAWICRERGGFLAEAIQ